MSCSTPLDTCGERVLELQSDCKSTNVKIFENFITSKDKRGRPKKFTEPSTTTTDKADVGPKPEALPQLT